MAPHDALTAVATRASSTSAATNSSYFLQYLETSGLPPSPPSSPPPPSPSSRNPYRVVKELGTGLQGRVLLAYDQDTAQYVAVKLPSAFGSDDDGSSSPTSPEFDARLLEYQVESIMQERKAQRLVQHENVLKYLCVMPGKKQGMAYAAMVMEYAPNGDLFDIIADTGALSVDASKVYFQQLLLGIQACHNAGVVHRDIKPENLLLDANFTLKICDFGLAHVAPRSHRVMLRDVSGTALYMAPEVQKNAAFRGTPVDVWSAGVVLFILLTSFPPFQSATKGDCWYDCVVSGRMDLFWGAQSEPSFAAIDASARDLISGLMCADPEKRLTVAEVLQHPWLRDADLVDRGRVFREMRERRNYSLGCVKSV